MKKSIDLTQGSISKQLLRFCFPIMLGTLVQLVVGLFVGLSSGVTVIISTFFGAKEENGIIVLRKRNYYVYTK